MDTKIQPVISPRKRGPYRQQSTEFKRAIVAKSFVEGASVSRLAREFNINANEVFTWRRQFADLQGTSNEGPAAALLPVTVLDSAARLWTYVRDDRPSGDTAPPAVWFAYTPDRKG